MNIEELTEQEKLKLAACLDPDAEENDHFTFGPEIEQNILAAMLMDRSFLIQAKSLVKAGYFANQAREFICDLLFKYFDKYHVIPPRHIIKHLLQEELKAKHKNEALYLPELETVYTCYEPQLQVREWLLDTIEEFAKIQALKLAYNKTVPLALGPNQDNGKWNKIWEILKTPFQISRNKDNGLDYFHTIEDWFNRQREKKEAVEIFTTGFETIDFTMGDGGGVRGELYGWTASPGGGKSLTLIKTTLANVVLGKKTLFLSLEMDADKVAKRFHAQLAKVNIHEIMKHETDVVNTVKGALEDLKEKYVEKIKKYNDDRFLIIKQFPAGTLDVNGLRSFIVQLANDNFKPDLVVVDYVGEMRDFAGMEIHESRQRLCRDLRALGIELQHCTWTALQPNRTGRQAQKGQGVLDDENIGDSYGQMRVFDGLWSINQSREEKAMNVARIFNIKLRDGKSCLSFPVFIDPMTLDFSQISSDEYKNRMSLYKETKATNISLDGKPFKPNPVNQSFVA